MKRVCRAGRQTATKSGVRWMSTPAAEAATAPHVQPDVEGVESVAANLATVRSEVQAACGQTYLVPRLVAVSKLKSVAHIRAAYDAGQRVFGENYAQELAEKATQLPSDIEWHMIGNVQRSNVKHVVKVTNLAVVETIDSAKIADKFNELLAAAGRSVRVFVQVNTSGEESKSGVAPDALLALCDHIRERCPSLVLAGLMTIGRPDSTEDFARLAELRASVAKHMAVNLGSLELSMGMSGDFAKAIEFGSTNVRVGSRIFGDRH